MAEDQEELKPTCPRCLGKGYVEVENAHEMELWYCPVCQKGKWGEIRG